jgi:Cysteine-rich CPXCG
MGRGRVPHSRPRALDARAGNNAAALDGDPPSALGKAAVEFIQGHAATCPHCGERIDLTLDLSVPEQSYIEDCPVCCRPMAVSYAAVDGELVELNVESAD